MTAKKTSTKKGATPPDHSDKNTIQREVTTHADKKNNAHRTPTTEPVTSGLPMSPISFVAPGTLTPNKNNTFSSLTGDRWSAFCKDVAKRGVIVPIVVDHDKQTILAGHNRCRAAIEVGLKHVPVQFRTRPLTPDETRRFLVSDNMLRRPNSAAGTIQWLAATYPEFFQPISLRGGDRRSSNRGGKLTAARIAAETGLSLQTIKRARVAFVDSLNQTPRPGNHGIKSGSKSSCTAPTKARKTSTPQVTSKPRPDKACLASKHSSTPADVLSGLLDQARQRLKTDTPESIAADLLVGLQGAGLISSRRIDGTRPVDPGRIGSIRQHLKSAIQRLRNAL